jgi:hypothetical protein
MADIREDNDGSKGDHNARRTQRHLPPAMANEIAENLSANAALAWGVEIFGRMNAQRFTTKEQAQRLADQIGGKVCN